MPGPDVPPESWFDSDAAHAVGPIERVYGPSGWLYFNRAIRAGFLTVASLTVGLFLVLLARVGLAEWLRSVPGGVDLFVLWLALLPGLGVLAVALLDFRFVRRDLAGRLLVGPRGLAWWTPTKTTTVLWTDLGAIWSCHPSRIGPTGIIQRRVDGAVVVVDAFFADHHAIVARVAAELTRRIDRRAWPLGLRPPSEAIRPDELGITEPRP